MLAAVCVVVGALYFARDVLIPIALAVMLSFLLGPLVTHWSAFGMQRTLAVSIIATVLFTCIGLLTWLIVVQVGQLADQLPRYQDNIVSKLRGMRSSSPAKFEKAAEVFTRAAEAVSDPTTRAATQPALVTSQAGNEPGASEANPLYVKPVMDKPSPLGLLGDYMGTAHGAHWNLRHRAGVRHIHAASTRGHARSDHPPGG